MHAGVYRVICGQAKAFAAYREGGSVVTADPVEGHECLPTMVGPGGSARLCTTPSWLSRPFLTACRCYMKMSWGNCSVKVSCPHGDFHDEPEGIAPGGLDQSGAGWAHHQPPSRCRAASHGAAGPTPQAALRERRGPSAAPSQSGATLAASVAGEARRLDFGAHDDYLRRL